MRLYELQIRQYIAGWFNRNTHDFVTHDRTYEHIHAVLNRPQDYDIQDLENLPKGPMTTDDEFKYVMNNMNKRGWDRVILDDNQLNIQTESINDARTTSKWFLNNNYQFDHIYFDIHAKEGNYYNLRSCDSYWIWGLEAIRQFVKYGKIPKQDD